MPIGQKRAPFCGRNFVIKKVLKIGMAIHMMSLPGALYVINGFHCELVSTV